MLHTLMESKDFLAFTLAQSNTDVMTTSFSFELGQHTRVEVWDCGVIVFEPHGDTSKDIVLSCAVHGNETAPIELCNDLIKRLLLQTIQAEQRLMFLIGNPEAIKLNRRFIDENLNRLFNGGHSIGETQNPERVRAKALEQYVERFYLNQTYQNQVMSGSMPRQRIHYDLHTAIRASKHEEFAIYPYCPEKKYSSEQIMFLAGAGIDTILFHNEPTTTFSYFSSHHFQADAFTVELGKVYPMGQNDMSRFSALDERLVGLITANDLPILPLDMKRVNLYQVARSIDKRFEDFCFSFANDVENFTAFQRGEVLATEGGEAVIVEHPMEVIVFPNAKVPVGQRTLLCLTPASADNIE
ncbi:succinylglutamate desuccinylase [Shewanella surugensis]|uniref:Succinylglutamate desuccinylase n=1 Tax=Shewanella surugensis TaxID=212020 RepID=A0ABT0L9T7_9GAMM|nr:succinylglutamate desuccinylase [Shewanella surugensis]MCL1124474.1 succinylglutamate desuccinylase [Shewanella surugensis]